MNKKYFLFFLLISCSLMSSCDDDEKETNPPAVTIDTPDGSSVLKGVVTIEASATDESEISSIKILIDETVVQETSGISISHEWNTGSISDGDHVIEVIATDVVGNEGHATLTVKTFNDKKAPVVTITAPSTEPYVKSTVTVAGSVQDDSQLASIKIFVDDVLLTTVSNTNSFSVNWDTKTVSDGDHNIRVSATDDRGNESSLIKKVSVFNYFLTLNVVNSQVPAHVQLWYLISKYDGTLIQAKPFVAGATKIQFETPANFNAADRYVLTTFQHVGKFENYAVQTNLYAETGISPGEIRISPGFTYSSFDGTNVVGYHSMKIANAQNYKSLYIRDVNNYSYSVQSDSLAIQIGYYSNNNLNPYVAILRGGVDVPRFKNFTGLAVGGKTKTDFENFTPMVGSKLATLPNATSSFNIVYGVTPPNYNESHAVWTYNSPFMETNLSHYLFHPAAAYPEYIFMAIEGSADENNFFIHVGAEVPATILRSNAIVNSFVKTGRALTLTTSGSYDMVSISGSAQMNAGAEFTSFYWSVQFPDGATHAVTLPQLPAEIDKHGLPSVENMTFTNVGFTDYSGFTGYQEYRNFIVNNPGANVYTVSKDFISKSVPLPSAGGRLKNDLFNQTHNIMMNNNRLLGLSPFYLRK